MKFEFGGFVCIGDTSTVEREGFTITARIEHDYDSRPEDQGFDPADPDHGEENARICEAWRRDGWHYSGVVLAVSFNGVQLTDHAASLWGVERNFPGSDNSSLAEVAEDLAAEALEEGRKALADLRAKICGGEEE